jgi:hypothetical protein
MARKIIAAIVLTIAFLALSGCVRNEATQAVTDNKTGTADDALVQYMTCLGFSDSASRKAINAAGGDQTKVLAMAHMSVTGDLSDTRLPKKRGSAGKRRDFNRAGTGADRFRADLRAG